MIESLRSEFGPESGNFAQFFLQHCEMRMRKLIKLVLHFPHFSLFQFGDCGLTGIVFMLRPPDVLEIAGLTEHFGCSREELGEGEFEESDEGLDVLGETDEEVLVGQVEFGLFQSPPASGLPTLKIKITILIPCEIGKTLPR